MQSEPEETLIEEENLADEFLTDLGNARRLARYFADDMRYTTELGWMIWDSRRWKRDVDGAAMRLAIASISEMREEFRETKPGSWDELRKHLLRSESVGRLNAMLEIAQNLEEFVVKADVFDQNPLLLNCLNGTIDLRDGVLRPHRREDMISKLAPVEFYSDAPCEVWSEFIDDTFAGNRALIEFVQRAIGYSLTADTREQVMFLMYGTGQNGKSTMLELLQEMLGEYSQRVPQKTLMAKDRESDGPSSDIARMAGVRFAYAIETDEGKRLAVALIKELTGQDTISARFMHREFFEFKPVLKLWYSVNHKPVIKDTTESIWRRVMLIPFEVKVSAEKRNTLLPVLLKEEASGILAWIARGCRDWLQGGLRPPSKVLAATAEYRGEMDVVAAFLDEFCVVRPLDLSIHVSVADLYKKYADWAESNGERPMISRQFSQRLKERGLDNRKSTGGVYHWFGIGLLSRDE